MPPPAEVLRYVQVRAGGSELTVKSVVFKAQKVQRSELGGHGLVLRV